MHLNRTAPLASIYFCSLRNNVLTVCRSPRDGRYRVPEEPAKLTFRVSDRWTVRYTKRLVAGHKHHHGLPKVARNVPCRLFTARAKPSMLSIHSAISHITVRIYMHKIIHLCFKVRDERELHSNRSHHCSSIMTSIRSHRKLVPFTADHFLEPGHGDKSHTGGRTRSVDPALLATRRKLL